MATKRKEESDEPRKDASGRELFDWEVDPEAQAEERQAAPRAAEEGGPGSRKSGEDAE